MSLLDRLMMAMRRVPVAQVTEAARLVNEHRLPVTLAQLEAHSLCGADPRKAIVALAEGMRSGIAPDWLHVTVVQLAGRDPVEAVRESSQPRTVVLSSLPGSDSTPLEGFARNGDRVSADATVTFRMPVHSVLGDGVRPAFLDRLSIELANSIFQAETSIAFWRSAPTLEARLARLATELGACLPSVRLAKRGSA